MDSFKIKGPSKISGTVEISGSKNAALPVMVATIARPGIYEISNVPDLRDTRTMIKLIEIIGGIISSSNNTLKIDTRSCNNPSAPYDLVKTMRASFYVLGPLLSRFQKASVSLPGGCAWGPRPVDFHLKAFEQMGAEVILKNGYIQANGKLSGADIIFKVSSVGATGNVLMGCFNLNSQLTIKNAAMEPEITDLCHFLVKMGLRIDGIGTKNLTVYPNDSKSSINIKHRIIPDRIEAGTFIAATVITKSQLTLKNVIISDIKKVLDSFIDIGLKILESTETSMTIDFSGEIKKLDITTDVFPGFPTDMQPQWTSVMCLSNGESIMEDTIYHDRFSHIPELIRLGANIKLNKNVVTINGVDKLKAADVMCTDLRAGAALILAALASEGTTNVSRVYHVDRGYENFESKLRSLGVEICRISS